MKWNRRESNPGLSGANRVLSQLSYGPIAASAPGRARTDDPRFTKPVLLPTELQGRKEQAVKELNPARSDLESKLLPEHGLQTTGTALSADPRNRTGSSCFSDRRANHLRQDGKTGAASAPAGNRTQFTW